MRLCIVFPASDTSMLGGTMPIQVRLLSNENEVRLAERLNYQAYIVEQGWKITPSNPSGLTVSTDEQGNYLTDSFSKYAEWIGGFQDGELISSLRFVPQVDGKFELERYHALPFGSKFDRNLTREFNRLAISNKARTGDAFVSMIYALIEISIQRKWSCLFTTVKFPEPGILCQKLGMEKEEVGFRYSNSDPNEVHVVWQSLKDPVRNESLLGMLRNFL